MTEPLAIPAAPMEAQLVEALPSGTGWQFEPKWDGFRCIVARDGARITLLSKAGKDLTRFFPEVGEMLAGLDSNRFVLDGELLLPIGETLSFAALQARLHPAQSRITRLATETPAELMLFDCLQIDDTRLADRPLSQRREALEHFVAGHPASRLRLSPCTQDRAVAQRWLARSGGALDGIVAKRREDRYQAGERAMLKLKQHRSADCVVGGFRYDKSGEAVGSLLLGLYDDAGLLNHVGFTAALPAAERTSLIPALEARVAPPGFTGKAPGGPSRWSTDRSADWEPLRPELVVEIRYDQVTAGRFRHGTRLLRWRPDKAPEQCRTEQLQRELRPARLAELSPA